MSLRFRLRQDMRTRGENSSTTTCIITTSQTTQRRLDTSNPRTTPLHAQPVTHLFRCKDDAQKTTTSLDLAVKMMNVSFRRLMERCLTVLLWASWISSSSIGVTSTLNNSFCLWFMNCVSYLFSFKSCLMVWPTPRTIVDCWFERVVAMTMGCCSILSRRINSDRWSTWHDKLFQWTTMSSAVLNRTLAEHHRRNTWILYCNDPAQTSTG